MPITDDTLAQVRQLRTAVGTEADNGTRATTKAWAAGWATVAPLYAAALTDVAASAVAAGRWPGAWDLARDGALFAAGRQAQTVLAGLADDATATATAAAGSAVRATLDAEPQVMASQLPPAERQQAQSAFVSAVTAAGVAALLAHVTAGVASLPGSVTSGSVAAMNRALTRPAGTISGSPQALTARLLAGVEHGFNSGLAAAIATIRTETLDAYRTAARRVHAANVRWVVGWLWQSSLDTRTCPSCWAMHGTVHPLTELGPEDHRQGRCARVVKLLPWLRLGITRREPADRFPDAKARFDALPEADQLAVMGPARLALLRSGEVAWADLAVRRANPAWRPAYVPRTVTDLRSRARAAAA